MIDFLILAQESFVTPTNILTTIIALIGGGGLVKVFERIYSRGEKKMDLAAELRQELRDESRELRTIIKELEDSLAVEKERYYELLEKYNELKQDYIFVKRELSYFKDLMMEYKIGEGRVKEDGDE